MPPRVVFGKGLVRLILSDINRVVLLEFLQMGWDPDQMSQP